jgi:hypothetical protein
MPWKAKRCVEYGGMPAAGLREFGHKPTLTITLRAECFHGIGVEHRAITCQSDAWRRNQMCREPPFPDELRRSMGKGILCFGTGTSRADPA